jgi:hypothetical protein
LSYKNGKFGQKLAQRKNAMRRDLEGAQPTTCQGKGLRKGQPCQHLDFELSVSRIVREYICIV